jgi:hypothetical protein
MLVTHTRDTDTGLLGYGYGLAQNTRGLPVVIPSQTRVMGTGFAGVTNCQPIPIPVTACDLNP